MFKGFVQFIKSKVFLINFVVFIALFFGIAWGVLKLMDTATKHGETVVVPNFSGVKLGELDAFVSGKNVKYAVIDSLYDPKSPKGVVVRQEPEANELVKEDRTIYLYITALQPPRITMPKLIDRSLRQASAMLISYGLKLGKLEYKSGECANCILEQNIKGKAIEPGQLVAKGTVIDLLIGKSSQEDAVVELPCLVGLSKKEAQEKLREVYLKIGTVTYDIDKDSSKSKVFDQTPSCKVVKVGIGTAVDLFLTTNKTKLTQGESNKKQQDEDFD